ncbi:MAG: transcriptional regulator [Oscillospiraceae bacterium]|nr:transcriptional regulator [Oscillospiraceae bacterium]
MQSDFSRSLSLLRQERNISQRTAATALGISQALLSHYENGIREPGLAFVVKACNYYNVSADFLLGRTLSRDGTTIVDAETLYDSSTEKDAILKGSLLATLSKKLLVNCVSLFFELLGKTGNRKAIKAASDYLGGALYTLYRHFYRSDPNQNEGFFSLPTPSFLAGLQRADMICAESDFLTALNQYAKEKGEFPSLRHDDLAQNYPSQYQSLLQVIHSMDERCSSILEDRSEKK